MKFIIASGDLGQGFVYVGPFDTHNTAVKHAGKMPGCLKAWEILPLLTAAEQRDAII